MNQTNPEPTNNQNPVGTPPEMGNQEGGRGAMIGTVIIIVLLVVAGAYVWMTKSPTTGSDEAILNLPDASIDALNQQSPSDEINTIEQDAANTNLNDLDSDFGNIQNELAPVQ